MALQHSKVGVTETFDFKFLLHYPGSFAETNKKLSRLRSGRHEWNCADGGTFPHVKRALWVECYWFPDW